MRPKALCSVNLFDKRVWEKQAMARQVPGYRQREFDMIARLQVRLGYVGDGISVYEMIWGACTGVDHFGFGVRVFLEILGNWTATPARATPLNNLHPS